LEKEFILEILKFKKKGLASSVLKERHADGKNLVEGTL
jgi:hypothetical protein